MVVDTVNFPVFAGCAGILSGKCSGKQPQESENGRFFHGQVSEYYISGDPVSGRIQVIR
jgi:hypothetical protein